MKLSEQVVELTLLLPASIVLQLEQAAHARGQSLGRLIRLLVRAYLLEIEALDPLGEPEPDEIGQQAFDVVSHLPFCPETPSFR